MTKASPALTPSILSAASAGPASDGLRRLLCGACQQVFSLDGLEREQLSVDAALDLIPLLRRR
jgi:hypothetical protein